MIIESDPRLPTGDDPEEPPFCILCLRESLTESRASFQNRRRSKKYYYVPIERFLGLQLFNNNSDNNRFSFQTCRDCSLLLDKFAALYGTWRRMELELGWKIGKIRDIMVCADRVPSRIAFVRGYYSDDKRRGRDKNKSDLEQVMELRGKLVRKCAQKLKTTCPLLKLKKLDETVVAQVPQQLSPVRTKNEVRSINEYNLASATTEATAPDNQAFSITGEVAASLSDLIMVALKEELQEPEEGRQLIEKNQASPESCHLILKEATGTGIAEMGAEPSLATLACCQQSCSEADVAAPSAVFVVSTPTKTPGNAEPPEELELKTEFKSCSTGQQQQVEVENECPSVEEGDLMKIDDDDFRNATNNSHVTSPLGNDDASSHSLEMSVVEKEEKSVVNRVDDDVHPAPSCMNNGDGNEVEGTDIVELYSRGTSEQADISALESVKELDNQGQNLLGMSRLRAHFRCTQCSKTFPSKSRFDSHCEEAHRELENNSDLEEQEEPPEVGSSSGDSEYQNAYSEADTGPSSETDDGDSDDLESGDECDDDDDNKSVEPPRKSRKVCQSSAGGDADPRKEAEHAGGDAAMHHKRRRRKSRPTRLEEGKTVECQVCSAKCDSLVYLRSHHKSHHDVSSMDPGEVHRCDFLLPSSSSCSAYFRTKRQLHFHKSRVHFRKNRPYPKLPPAAAPLPLISETQGGDPNSNNNIRIFTKFGGEDRWCSICDLEFELPALYRKHFGNYHDISKVSSSSPDAVQRCPQTGCSAHFLLQSQLRDHLFRAHRLGLNNERRKVYACPVCPKSFSDMSSRRKHYEGCHELSRLQNPEDKQVHKCDQPNCTAYFIVRRQLDLHRGEFHGKWYECDLCQREFRSLKNLNRHRHKVHKKEIQLEVACEVEGCGKRFETEEARQRHHKFWHKGGRGGGQGAKPVSCPKCDRTFPYRNALMGHLRSHSVKQKKVARAPAQSKSWVCEQCGKGFKEKKHLDVHYKSHAGSDSWEFQCSACGKKCLTKQKLEEHLRTHTGEKPFCCEHCGVSYAHKHNLRIHVNSKHPEVTPDLPKPFDKTNLTSRKGTKLKKHNKN